MADDASWTDLDEVRPEFVEAAPIRHGMVLAGRYAIERIIGRGASGVVVRAHDRDLRQEVAIKIVRAELVGQRQWAVRLAREVKLARQIQHPHVCRVFDFEQADGRAFLVMELAEQGSLRDELRSGALVTRPLVARIADARAVASALAAIHATGIIHRDLSPQNLLRMGDGRLVLSDFGLATDASESTSVHGGTVAYMAPEVMLGGKASVASDIWSLGVVMHEMVFGAKPLWSGAADLTEMRAPELGRKLTEDEMAVLEACRACTVKDPRRRLAPAEEAGRLLTERRRWWARRPAVGRRRFVWAVGLTLVVAVAMGVARMRRPAFQAPAAAPSTESPLIVPTGEPADWTDISTVIAEVPDRIHCTRLLPDQRTIRFVWGTPMRADDVDAVTQQRVPSPLVPAAYAEGCPDLSPDGKRLVYQGHAPDGRAFAFLSDHSDGRDATPAVPTAEPSMSSEPTWLADGQTFALDVDSKHMGVFAVATRRLHVLPEISPSFVTLFRATVESRVFVEAVSTTREVTMVAISAPALTEAFRFRLPELAFDLRSRGAMLYYASGRGGADIVELDLVQRRARSIGQVPRQLVRFPMFPSGAMAFVSILGEARAFVRQPRGLLRPLGDDRNVTFARHCGADFIVSVNQGTSRALVKRIDSAGGLVRIVGPGPEDVSGACAPDGRSLYYVRLTPTPALLRCSESECQPLFDGPAAYPDVSPDGTRVAFMTFDRRGPVVNWMSVNGGEVHEVSETETGCAHGWASTRTLWVSRRRGGEITWTEVEAESGRETGNRRAGTRDCADGRANPASPVAEDLPIVYDQTSQIRLLDSRYLEPR